MQPLFMVLVVKTIAVDITLKHEVDSSKKITKQKWIASHEQLQVHLDAIGNSIWDEGGDEVIVKNISNAIYLLAALACEAGKEDMLRKYLHAEPSEQE